MAAQTPRDARWTSSFRDSTPVSSTRWQSTLPAQSDMAPIPPAPEHPMPQMQGAFEESMRETMAESDAEAAANPYLNADKFERRKLLLESARYERTVAGRWLQKPRENFHPLWKLVAQISFGMHLLHKGLARSDADVIQILQTHVDEIDGFLERTTEDFELAEQDVHDRIKHLRTPLEHGDVFDTMLGDRDFRAAIVDGNEKIEHILGRTTVAMKDSLKDIQKGLDGTRQLARFLKDIDRKWPNKSHEHAAVYTAMFGNTEGWAEAYKSLQQKGSDLNLSLVQLEGIVSEIQRRAGVASRRNLPGRHSTSSSSRRARDSLHSSTPTQVPRVDLPIQLPVTTLSSATDSRKYLPTEPSTILAMHKDGKASQAIELPADVRQERHSMQASLIQSSSSTKTRSSVPSQAAELQSTEIGAETGSIEHEPPVGHSDITAQLNLQPSHVPEADTETMEKLERLESADTQQAIPQPVGQTYFGYVSDDTASQDAQSAQSKDRGLVASHIRNGSSLSSGDFADLGDEEGVVNHAHPLLQDLRVREALVVHTSPKPTAQDVSKPANMDSLSYDPRRNSFRDSDTSTCQVNTLGTSPQADTSDRYSDHSMATPISLMTGERDLSKATSPSGLGNEKRLASPRVPPVITDFSKSPGSSSFPQIPPSPPLEQLTSATLAGPDIGDPFAPKSPIGPVRHPELVNRIQQTLNHTGHNGGPPSAEVHSRNPSRTIPDPSYTSTVTTTTTTIIPYQPQATVSSPPVPQRASLGPDLHPQVQTYAGQRTGPSSPPITTQYHHLSPFPSTSSRGSRRPSASTQDLTSNADGSQPKKSSFKKLFAVKRNSRNQSIGNV